MCSVCIRPIFRFIEFVGNYLRVPFFATDVLTGIVDIGFVVTAAAGLADAGAEVVVVVGSGSSTGVTGVVGFGKGFAAADAM